MTSPITIVGNLTDEPELRFTPSGHAVANFTVAVNERVKNGDQWEDGDATYYRCAAWRQMAENVAETFQKGQRVLVVGGFKARPYQDKDGNQRLSLDVDVEHCGPDLRWATAQVSRATGGQSNSGGGQSQPRQQPQQQAQAASQPWGAPAANSEPPF